MTEAEWLASDDLEVLVWWAGDPNRSLRKLRLFAVACARAVWDRITDASLRRAVEIGERYADGEVGNDERHECAVDVGNYSERWAPPERRVWATGTPEQKGIYVLCRSAVSDDSSLMFLARKRSGKWGVVLTEQQQLSWLRDIFGNPFRPVTLSAEWRTDTAVLLARQMYDTREFSAMPILADALQDAGCDNDDILDHCRDANAAHVRGCWVVDLVLGKE